MKTHAYVNWGRWVADCARPGCTSAIALEPGQTVFHCSNPVDGCGAVSQVEWPLDAADITRMLDLRPVPNTRNWTPSESLTDLVAENLEHGVI